MESVTQYLPGFDEWQKRPKFGWREGTYIYSRAGSELVVPEGSMGRRAVDEFDENIGYYSTREIVGSLESEELLDLIKNDPRICGTCALDSNGDPVCTDGPVFSNERLSKISEFGVYHHDSTRVRKKF